MLSAIQDVAETKMEEEDGKGKTFLLSPLLLLQPLDRSIKRREGFVCFLGTLVKTSGCFPEPLENTGNLSFSSAVPPQHLPTNNPGLFLNDSKEHLGQHAHL